MISSELLKGTMSTIILSLLAEKGKLYGYEMVQLVKERSEEKILLKDGSLYPALHKLEAEGLIKSEIVYVGSRVRKYYHLTPMGKKKSIDYSQELKRFFTIIEKLILPFPTTYVPTK